MTPTSQAVANQTTRFLKTPAPAFLVAVRPDRVNFYALTYRGERAPNATCYIWEPKGETVISLAGRSHCAPREQPCSRTARPHREWISCTCSSSVNKVNKW